MTSQIDRRRFLSRTLQGSSLLALGSVVPGFLVNTAQAAEAGKDTILVVVELTGGNDGLNTVIPYADDLYHKARPTLAQTKKTVLKVDDAIGLHPALDDLRWLLQQGQVAMIQGVGYPNPDRSHFEAMDIWQSADPARKIRNGWIARSVPGIQDQGGSIPVMQVNGRQLPLALKGSAGVVSVNNKMPFRLELGNQPDVQKARRQLIEKLARPAEGDDSNNMLHFVQRRQLQTYTNIDRLHDVLGNYRGQNINRFQNRDRRASSGRLTEKLGLVAHLISKEFGTRVFYVTLGNFDTHSKQAQSHENLLRELGSGINNFFNAVRNTGHDRRVLLMTFSEFGRRVQENGAKGTDHGAASCMLVAGPAVKGGPLGKHPSLSDLDFGDLKHQVDFRSVYATLLEKWLHCDSKAVLGSQFPHVPLVKS